MNVISGIVLGDEMVEESRVISRKSNIELLRIIAMFLIIGHHLTVHGIMHYETKEQFIIFSSGSFVNKIFCLFLFPGGEVGVAVFFMIAGYFCIRRTTSVKLVWILLQTSFYGILSFAGWLLSNYFVSRSSISFPQAVQFALRSIVLPSSGGGGTGL